MKTSSISAAILLGAATLTAAFPSPSLASLEARDDDYAVVTLIARNDTPHELSGSQFNVTMGHLYHDADLVKVTSITILDASTNVPNQVIDLKRVVCQRFKDEWALQPGSARFSGKGTTTILDTNPVELGWILCYTVPQS